MRNNKGITLISLTVVVVILVMITGAVIYNSKNQVNIQKINSLLSDIDSLESKINEYYLKYGEIPTICLYLDKEELVELLNKNANLNASSLNTTLGYEVNPNDGDEYYVIDLEKLDGLSLTYGYDDDYNTIKSAGTYTSSSVEDEIYIINGVTHQIYFPKGISSDGIMYYSSNSDEFAEIEFERY